MLGFFSKKERLVDLIPEGFVDIHGHYLPGIDDGAHNIEESKTLFQAGSQFGFKKIIATPHTMNAVWVNSKDTIQNALKEVVESSIPKDFGLKVEAASEYMLDEVFLSKLDEGLLTLKDNFVLVEMSYLTAPINLYELLFQIQLKGYIPVLAHPERYNFYHNNFKEYQKLKDAGCKFQLNLLSLGSYYGSEVNKTTYKILKEGMYDFVGSDIHHMKHVNALKELKIEKKFVIEVKRLMEHNITVFK